MISFVSRPNRVLIVLHLVGNVSNCPLRNGTTPNCIQLSSPRAESAKAFTGRRNSHSGRGEDFLTGQPNSFTETAVTPEQKVKKSFPRWEINRHVEG